VDSGVHFIKRSFLARQESADCTRPTPRYAAGSSSGPVPASTQRAPLELFEADERSVLLTPPPAEPFE